MPHFTAYMCRSAVEVHPPFGGSRGRFTPLCGFSCSFARCPVPGDVRRVGYPSSMFAAAALVERARVAGGVAAVAAVSALAGFSPSAANAADGPCVGAGMLAVLVPTATVPVAVGPELSAVDRQSVTTESYADTADGSGLKVAHVVIGVSGCIDAAGTPGGTSTRTTTWSALGGAVGGTSLQVDLVPVGAPGTGWHLRPKLDGLLISGAPVTLDEGATIGLGNWGILDRPDTIDAGAPAAPLRFWKAALEVRLIRAHAGFAAGTHLLFGWVSADRAPAVPPPPVAPPPTTTQATTTQPVTTTVATTTTTTTPKKKSTAATTTKKHKKAARHPKKKRKRHVSRKGLPLLVTPPVGPGTYDFPVLGSASWGDTYGAGRSDVPGGWHHGDDLFVSLGTPVVAVADGIVFAVGWNSVGGWRLWLEDDQGNDFYYAHFSGYTKLARNNARVRRGQVLGFVGNTGDAFTTIPHLHFEVHPFGLLSLGYDGAVDPTRYLAGWQRPGSRTDILPPVPLPSPNFRGSGSLTDYRRLLALRPLAKPPASPPGAASPAKTPRIEALGAGSATSGASDGWVPAASGALLLALAAVAVWLTAREGRAR